MLKHNHSQRGSVLLMTFIFMMVLITVGGSYVIMISSQSGAISQTKRREVCYGILQAAMAHSLKEMNLISAPPADTEPTYNGNNDDGIADWTAFGGGRYRIAQRWEEGGRHTVLIQAQYNGIDRYAMAIAQADVETETVKIPGEPFIHAIFQGGANDGNEGKAPGEKRNSFIWGGKSGHLDQVRSFPPDPSTYNGHYPDWDDAASTPGNMYVGDNLHVTGDAVFNEGGTLRADGTVTVNSKNVDPSKIQVKDKHGDEDPKLDSPEAPDYATRDDVVYVRPEDFNARVNYNGYAYMFGGGYRNRVGQGDAFGQRGNQWSYKHKNDPRHIFRKNSTNMNVLGSTDRDDFFLEDMFASNGRGYSGSSGRDEEPSYDGPGNKITIPEDGNHKVYVVYGNLWLNNRSAYTFKFMTQGDGTRVTFAAKGNIFISDNVTYENMQKDAVAFVALKEARDYPQQFGVESGNETEEGSGNIQFGDPDCGTTYRFCGFMYAENSFRTDNVSNDLHVYGNMTAGSKIMISRGTGNKRKTLIIDYDARIQNKLINLPGLPENPEGKGTIKTVTEVTQGSYNLQGMTEISLSRCNSILGQGSWNKPDSWK